MTQYDAGPGDWSDREWESPDRKQKPQAKRRFTLPAWALAVTVVALAIVLCVGAVLVVKAIQKGNAKPTPTSPPAATTEVKPTATYSLVEPTTVVSPTATAELPRLATVAPPTFTEIAPGATVVVQGTRGLPLNIRAAASTGSRVIGSVKEGALLTVLEGPQQAGGYTWWKVRTADGKEGWAAGEYLVLKTVP